MSTLTQVDRTSATQQTSAHHLAAELNRLGVLFLRSSPTDECFAPLSPAALLACLAASDEARLRLALIPLLLARPDYAAVLPAALNGLSTEAQVVLRCYATAAVLLQQQYAARLDAIFGPQPRLPDLFSTELGVQRAGTVGERLSALADRQRALGGRKLNWTGTYMHGAESFLHFMEQQQRWSTLMKA